MHWQNLLQTSRDIPTFHLSVFMLAWCWIYRKGINSLQAVCWKTTVSRKVYRDELSFVNSAMSTPQCNVIHAPFKTCTLVYQFLFVLFYSDLISHAWPTVGMNHKIWLHCQLHSGHTDFSTLCLCSNKLKKMCDSDTEWLKNGNFKLSADRERIVWPTQFWNWPSAKWRMLFILEMLHWFPKLHVTFYG